METGPRMLIDDLSVQDGPETCKIPKGTRMDLVEIDREGRRGLLRIGGRSWWLPLNRLESSSVEHPRSD